MKINKNINKTSASKKVKLVGSVLTAGMLMFGSAAFAQERDNVSNSDVDEFNQYDSNADQQWDKDEFNSRMDADRSFDAWDTDRDGILNEDEFNEGNRGLMDQRTQPGLDNQQEGIPEDENAPAEGVMGQENESLNNEGVSDEQNLGTFGDWDADQDGSINRDEYNEGVYKNWDSNQDGSLDNDEYNNGVNTFGTSTEEGLNNNQGTETEMNEGTETDIDSNEGTDINQGTGTEMESNDGTDINQGTEINEGTETEVSPGTGN